MTGKSDRAVARRGGAFGRFARPIGTGRRSGQILVMTLLAISLMVGLIFFVYNTGDYVNRRLTMQNVADAVAISGAGWTARSMNVIAMNNCAESRMLALVPIFDALPLATEMALKEITAWEAGLGAQLGSLPATKEDYLREGLANLQHRMASQRDILAGLHEAFSVKLDMRTVTHWAIEEEGGPRPHGSLWRTAKALEEFSFMTWQSSALLAQANAVRFGQANGADVALLLPLTPMVPARVGEYTDFRPVIEGYASVYYDTGTMRTTGGSGGGIPDFVYPYRLGPWAQLYKWRNERSEGEPGVFVPDPVQPPAPDPGPPVIIRGSGGGGAPGGRTRGGSVSMPSSRGGQSIRGHWEGGWSQVVGWITYGPYRWALSRAESVGRDVPDTWYRNYIHTLSEAKRSYMWATPAQLRTIYYPEWTFTGDYPAAKAMAEDTDDPPADPQPEAEDDTKEIRRTLYYRVEVYSSIPPTSGNYLTPGTFLSNGDDPKAIWMSGWKDAATWGDYEQVGNYVWRYRNQPGDLEVTHWPEIGITYTESTGEPVFHSVYLEIHYVWGGVDIGEDVDIRNPFNWEEGEQPPRPLLFYPGPNGELDYMSGYGRGKAIGYGFLGVVGKKVGAKVWPSRFVDISPVDGIVTVAHVKLFNNRSWDLWTQDWQVQLSPISRWDEWLWELEKAWAELDMVGDLVDADEFEVIDQYLRNINEDMILRFFRH